MTFDKHYFLFNLVDRKMQKDKVSPCTNTPGDSNNNAAILGSCRPARAVRPFVSRGHSLHYNPKDKAPWGATQDQVGGGIVPHSMHTSPLLQTDRKYTLQRCAYKKLKANNKREHTNGSTLTRSGRKMRKSRGRHCVGDKRENKLLINLPFPFRWSLCYQ